MSAPQPSLPSELRTRQENRTRTTLAAFFVGLPMAAGILCLIHFGPLRETVARRYVSHPLECVEVVMFCAALGALGAKFVRYLTERRACSTAAVPPMVATATQRSISENGSVSMSISRTFLKFASVP